MSARFWFLALLLFSVQPAFAADGVEELLPANSEQFLVLRVKHLLASPAYQKYAAVRVKKLLSRPEVQDVLGKMAFDPLKDLDRIVLAVPAVFDPLKPEGVIVIGGHFDSKRLMTAAFFCTLRYKGNVELVRDGPHRLVKLSSAGTGWAQELYLAVVDDNRIVIGPRQDEVRAALDRAADKKPPVVNNKALLQTLAAADPNLCAVGRLDRTQVRLLTGTDAPGASQLSDAVGYGLVEVRVAADVRVTLSVQMNDPAGVRSMKPVLTQAVEQAKGMTRLLLLADPRLTPVAETASSLQVTAKGRAVLLQGRLSPQVLQAFSRMAD
jgi:hypothetical protein